MLRFLTPFFTLLTLSSAQTFGGGYGDQNYNRVDNRYPNARTLRYENNNNGDGHYNYHYEIDDGTVASQRGYPKQLRAGDGTVAEGNAAEGFYQYYAKDGQLIRVDYVADENGFQPRGDHLPVPPPIPEAIQKSLDLIYAGIEKQKNAYRPTGNQAEYDYYQRGNNKPYRNRPEGGYQTPRPYANQ